MIIRRFREEDAPVIAELFHHTVHTVNIQDYFPQQIAAWAPENLQFRDWLGICAKRFTFVAEENDAILGFAELEKDGYIGCFYCHKDHQRKGIGSHLYKSVETQARQLDLSELIVEASITAKPFFLKMGFQVRQKQTVFRRGETFVNYRMIKVLCRND